MSGELERQRPNGRPRTDDSRRVQRILFAENILKHGRTEALKAEAEDVIRESQAAADAAKAKGKRKPVITRKAARKRLGNSVKAELDLGHGPLTGLTPSLRLVGAITGAVAKRDGYAAGRRLLVEALGYSLAFGRLRDPVQRDPATGGRRIQPEIARENARNLFECLPENARENLRTVFECMLLADEYISQIEAQCRTETKGENPTARG